MENIKHVIFDFDGTIANSFETTLDITKQLANSLNINLSREEIEYKIKNNSFKSILEEFNPSKIKILLTLRKAKKLQKTKIENQEIKPFPNTKKTLEYLSKKYTLSIISSNAKPNIEIFLKHNNFEKYFKEIISTSIFSKTKAIKKYLKQNKLNENQVIYIGDEIKDYESCQRANVKCLNVNYGFNSEKLIKTKNPNKTINKIDDLIKIF